MIAHSSEQVVSYLCDVDEAKRQAIAAAAKRRTPERRALEVERYVAAVHGRNQIAAAEPAPTMEAA